MYFCNPKESLEKRTCGAEVEIGTGEDC